MTAAPWRVAAASLATTLATALAGPQARAQTAIPPPPRDFAAGLVQSDQYEMLAARDALAQSRDPGVRGFAQRMIDDHARLGETVRQAAAAAGLPPPPEAMSGDHAAMLSALQGLRGSDFDQAYARQQVLAHRQALAVARSFAAAGAEANLRRAAQSAAPMIRQHLEMAEQMRAALGGS